MKKAFTDYFKHEYQVELTVRPDEVVPGSETQLWNKPLPADACVLDGKVPYDIETARALLYDREALEKEPEWLRLDWSRPQESPADETPQISAAAQAKAFGEIIRSMNELVGERKTMLAVNYRSAARTAEDLFYDVSVYKQLRLAAALIGQVSFTAEEGSTSSVLLRLTEQMLPYELTVHDSGKEQVPTYTTPTGTEVPLLTSSVSCSEERERVSILIANLHPYRTAVARVRLYGFDDMRPTFAASVTKTGAYKEISLRKYRPMDHVNLEVPPARIAVMVLQSSES